jgi:transposase
MKEKSENKYVRRTQKDYSYSFKLAVVHEFESGQISRGELKRKYGIQGDATIRNWLEKYGTFDWSHKTPGNMPKTPEQKILELEQKVRMLEKQKKQLEFQVEQSDKKAILFDMMIDIAEAEFNIPIRKKSLPGQSTLTKKNTKRE